MGLAGKQQRYRREEFLMELGGTLVFCGSHVGLAYSFSLSSSFIYHIFSLVLAPHFYSSLFSLFFCFLYSKEELSSSFFWMAFDMDGTCSEALTNLPHTWTIV
jgi:hypothetical protein